jgi:cytochrome-b5 reductase
MFSNLDLERLTYPSLVLTTVAGAAVLIYFFVVRNRIQPTVLTKALRNTYRRWEVKELTWVSHDTLRLLLALPTPKSVLGLPVGGHLKFRIPNVKGVEETQWNGRQDPEDGFDTVDRKYTPTTGDETKGSVEFVIKIYGPGDVKMPNGQMQSWTDGGKAGRYLKALKVTDVLEVSGPWGDIEYKGESLFVSKQRTFKASHVIMLAGGTGLTPMLQVMQAIAKEMSQPGFRDTCPKVTLLLANKTEGDILCKDLIDDLAQTYPNIHVHYTLDFPPPNWTGLTGFITADMISQVFPPASSEILALMCGPPPMVKFACQDNLTKLGYTNQLVF